MRGQRGARTSGPPACTRASRLLDFARAYASASALLLDADVEGYGGGGKVFDWSLIPPSVPVPLVLSGGLNPANVIDGMMHVRPWAVDVSSGVEASKRRQGCRADPPVLRCGARGRCAHRRRHPLDLHHHVEHYQQPDARGHFGPYGGSFVAETLVHALDELQAAYPALPHGRRAFVAEFRNELKHFVGRPSPVYHAARLSREVGGAQIYLKREDLNHTGAHKINNTIGQALLAKPHGQAARHRRDRRRPARRGHRHDLRALRHGVRGLHGQRGRQAPVAQRLPHAPARRQGGAGRQRLARR